RGIRTQEPGEIDRGLVTAAGRRYGNGRPRPGVLPLAERNDDAEAVDGAALEDGDQLFRAAALARRERSAGGKRRRGAEADAREGALFEGHTSCLPGPIASGILARRASP